MWRVTVQLLCVISAVRAFSSDFRIVKTAQGPVRGYKSDIENVYAFYSIPYATVPTGLDRFKEALPPPTWTEIFEATEDPVLCPQNGHKLDTGDGYKEQCLVASVFTPNTTNKNIPVVVYVHGGGYNLGYGNDLTPKHLVQTGKIVAVTFNYRLGSHGFLCLGTERAPGNAGIKDQIKLLRWVQTNIASFGGDPSDVTLSGCSAGSSSIDLIMLSKLGKGLFNKVIPESGANVQGFSVQIDPIENAKWYARQLNFENVDDINALENFYLDTPLNVLTSVDLMSRTDATTVFSPCLERDLGQEIFLDDSPVNILSSGNYIKYPMLYGITEMEGLIQILKFEEWKHLMNENFANFLPHDLNFDNDEEKQNVADKVKHFYFGDEDVGEHNVLKYVDYLSDSMFGYATLRSAKLQAEAGNDQLYLYKYLFVDEDVRFVPHTNVRGAGHCAQAFTVLDSRDENAITEEYKAMKRLMRELWLNFILTKEPVPRGSVLPEWRPVSPDNLSYMELNSTLEYKDRMMYDRMQFWEQIYDKYYQLPSPPNPDGNFAVNNCRISPLLIFVALLLFLMF